jgi:hypothetical protein
MGLERVSWDGTTEIDLEDMGLERVSWNGTIEIDLEGMGLEIAGTVLLK